MQVFVAGAAGKTGRKVVEFLVSQGLQVRAGVRVRLFCRQSIAAAAAAADPVQAQSRQSVLELRSCLPAAELCTAAKHILHSDQTECESTK